MRLFPSVHLMVTLFRRSVLTYRVVQQVEPVVQVTDKRQGVGHVVSLRAEEQQHGQRHVLTATLIAPHFSSDYH